jgi:HPt (histidine-containing phosphotransfer) domain-containing protein
MIEFYLTEAPKLLQTMQTALAASDFKTLRRSVHTLLSSSATLGALELAKHCEQLENLIVAETLTDVAEQVLQIEAEYQRAQRGLQLKLAELRAHL